MTVKVTLHPVGESGTTKDLAFSCSVQASSRMRRLSEIVGAECTNNPNVCTGEHITCDIGEGSTGTGKCVCERDHVLNGDKTECVVTVGDCVTNNDVDTCTDTNAECVNGEDDSKKCVCKSGFVFQNNKCTTTSTPEPTPGCTISGTSPTPQYGNYTVTPSSEGNTFKDSEVKGAYFRYDANVALGTAQTTSQTVDSESSDKKSFSVAFDTAVETALPRFYTAETSEKEIPCTLSTDKKTATCTPTSDHMKDGEKYTIYYRTNCAKKGTTTGIEVTYESSAYAKLRNGLLIALGLFLF